MVGKESLAYCTSCKMDLGHNIVAMKGDRIAKVECRTCKKTHVYKAPKGVTEPGQEGAAKPKRAGRKKADADTGAPIEQEWERLMSINKNAPLKPYSIKAPFILGDKINHPTFGEGIVGKIIYPNKMEVIFRTDLKILIHGGQV